MPFRGEGLSAGEESRMRGKRWEEGGAGCFDSKRKLSYTRTQKNGAQEEGN